MSLDIRETLPCGVDIHITQIAKSSTILVNIEDPTAYGSFSIYDNGHGLVIAIRESNVKKLKEIFDMIDPQPKPTFFTHLRRAIDVLRT